MKDDGEILWGMVHENPFDSSARLVLSDWLEENGDQNRAGSLRRGNIPLRSEDVLAAEQLSRCNFSPATWDKKFALNIGHAVASGLREFTPKQWCWTWILLRRYRRSVGNPILRRMAEVRYKGLVCIMGLAKNRAIDIKLNRRRMDMRANMFDDQGEEFRS